MFLEKLRVLEPDLWRKLDEEHRLWVWPAGQVPSAEVWNEARFDSCKNAGHLKRSASEWLNTYSILRWTAIQILGSRGPLAGKLEAEFKSMLLFCRVLDCLASHPNKKDAKPLLQAMLEHFHSHIAAYGHESPLFNKIKIHMALHIPEVLCEFGELLGCFVHERKHKSIKASGSRSTKLKDWERTVTTDIMNEQAQAWIDDTTLTMQMWLEDVRDGSNDLDLRMRFPLADKIIVASKAACNGQRSRRGDFVFAHRPAKYIQLVRIRCHVQCPPSPLVMALCDEWSHMGDNTYKRKGSVDLFQREDIITGVIDSEFMFDKALVALDPPKVAWGIALGLYERM